MKAGSHILILSFICGVFFTGACGIESQEATFKYRLQSLDELAAKAPADMKTAIMAEKAGYEESYKKLPAAEEPRSEALGKLNQASRAFIDTMQKKLEETASAADAKLQASEKAAFGARLNTLAGDWQGAGMRLIITPDGTVEYERLAGGVKKSITGGTVTRIGTDSIDVKVLVGSTTFRIDGLPRKEGTAWKMKVDGVELLKR